MTPLLFLVVAVAGGLGAVARFVLDGLIRSRAGARMPWGTLAINLSGSLLLGLLVGALRLFVWVGRGVTLTCGVAVVAAGVTGAVPSRWSGRALRVVVEPGERVVADGVAAGTACVLVAVTSGSAGREASPAPVNPATNSKDTSASSTPPAAPAAANRRRSFGVRSR